MSPFGYFIALGVGFAMSGVVSSLYKLVTSESPDFMPISTSLTHNIVAIMLSMFAGPFIIGSKIWTGMMSREMRVPLMALLVVIFSLWSFYSGIAVLVSVQYVKSIVV